MNTSYFKLMRSGRQFYFVLRARNHRTVLVSERYVAHVGALRGIEAVRNAVQREHGFDRKVARNGEAMFNVVARNGEIVGTSETYSSPSARERGIAAVVTAARDAVLWDISIPAKEAPAG